MKHFFDEWGPELVAAGGATVVAFAGGALTEIGPWYRSLKKPSWQPPNWLFAPAWTLIFVLAATAAVMGWYGTTTAAGAATLIALFIFNGILNILWSLFFFKMRRPDWSQFEVGFLWLSIVSLMVVVGVYAGKACLLLAPYLLWVSFAAFLNFTIVRLNAPFKGR
jgi:tryptophan-rich sensory protein